MPELPFQIITLASDLIIFVFITYYLLSIHKKEKELEKKSTDSDTSYHKIVDDALSKERKIVDDATQEAGQIITGAQNTTDSVKQTLEHSLQALSQNMQQQSTETAKYYMTTYQSVLNKVANASLSDFQTTTQQLNAELQKQTAEMRMSMLPRIEKELEEYKEARMKETEQLVGRIIQKASQDIFNRTINTDDHHKLMIEALEKARKEGLFD